MQLGRRPVFFGLGLATLVGGFGRSAYSRRWRDRPQQTPHPLGGTAPTGDTSENAGSGTANDTASPAAIEGYCSATSVVQGGGAAIPCSSGLANQFLYGGHLSSRGH